MNKYIKYVNEKCKLSVLIVIISLIFSGCIANSETKQTDQVSQIASPTTTASPRTNEVSQSVEQNKIKELEDKIDSMQQQITYLRTRLDRIGLPEPSTRSLIPSELPFKIEFQWGQMQIPMQYAFKGSEVEITDSWGEKETAAYALDRINNTIKLYSKKYDFYGIVLYDDYATAIYENGWIAWGKKYRIIQRYNPVTQKYEI